MADRIANGQGRTPPRSPRVIAAGVVGNVLEWYDFALFGFFAPVIGALFFPHENRHVSLLQTFGVFAVGYLARFAGGAIFGHIGDRRGRRRALQLSIVLMAIPSALVGLLPTYERVGLLAPIALIVLRLAQGISVGGEFIGSVALLTELSGAERRGLLGSLGFASGTMGILLGSGVAALATALLPQADLVAWGWRAAFVAGLTVGVVGFWFRRGLGESAAFAHVQASGQLVTAPVAEAIRRHPRAILESLALSLAASVGFYIPFVWVSTWLSRINRPPLPDALSINTLALVVLVGLIPLGGALGDRFGRRQIFVTGCAGYVVLSYVLFDLLASGQFGPALLGQLIFAVCAGLAMGALPGLLVERFPTQLRYSGVALGYNGAQSIFGGTAPLVATWLLGATGTDKAPALYLMAAMAVSALTALGLRRSGP
jgi:MHS family proline/betaine transporter-like MFS transporter